MSKKKSWEEENTYTGDTPTCPECGTPLTKKFIFSGMYCENCRYGLEDDDDEDESGERLSVWDAADISTYDV